MSAEFETYRKQRIFGAVERFHLWLVAKFAAAVFFVGAGCGMLAATILPSAHLTVTRWRMAHALATISMCALFLGFFLPLAVDISELQVGCQATP
jgi:hypothetical protein